MNHAVTIGTVGLGLALAAAAIGRSGESTAPESTPPSSLSAASSRHSASDTVTYHIDEGAPESGFRAEDRDLALWALEAWADQTDPALTLVPAQADEAFIRIHWVRADEGLYGEARLQMIAGRPVADVYVRPDIRGLGPDIEAEAARDPLFRDVIVYLTCVHEFGHAFGLPHTRSFADIMYSFQFGGDFVGYFQRFRNQFERREDIPAASPFSVADVEAFRAVRATR